MGFSHARRTGALTLLLSAIVLLAGRCGGSSSPSSTATITITPTGPNPTQVRVSLGTRVTFLNSDSRAHEISSDPLETHTDCPAINDVGALSPGQSRSTGVLDIPRTCGYHDHLNENDPTWHGQIVVQ